MSIRAHLRTLMTLLCLTAPVFNGAFAMDTFQTATAANIEKALRTPLKQEANGLAVNAVDLYREAGHVILPVFKTIE